MEQHIVIAGAGGIGSAVGLLLANYPEVQGTLLIGDRRLESAQETVNWISEGKIHPIAIEPFQLPEAGTQGMEGVGQPGGILLDCLPGSQAPRMARFALDNDMHYVNLTEFVAQTEEIREMANGATRGFILQTGLAPGYINILARKLYDQFTERYGIQEIEDIEMRVGAITEHTCEPHFYGFTWSPVGVATEYIKKSVCLENGEIVQKGALSDREELILGGIRYEADLTSGGASDLPYYFKGKARNVNYKTIRYPGHYKWVESIIARHAQHERPVEALEKAMLDVVPAVEDDLIVLYAGVSGRDRFGILRKIEKAMKIGPVTIGGKRLRAIQATTAAPMAECTRLLMKGSLHGPILQSGIPVDDFLTGPFVEKVYGKHFTRAVATAQV